MKRVVFIIIAILASCASMSAQSLPSWVKQMPSEANAYIGIASAPISNPDYREAARLSALNEIAAQIAISIESTSFLKSLDVDGDAKQLFEQSINENLSAHLGGHEMVDSYMDDTNYYVFYKLDKFIYEEYIARKREEVIKAGLDNLVKGKNLEANGDLINALAMYAKGLELVEPYLNLSLDGMYSGRYVNVATELFLAYQSIFSGAAITTNNANLTVEALKTISEPVAVCLSKNGVVVPNVLMSAEFVAGDGHITPATKTDYTGTATFYVTNVTSKDDVQSIDIGIDDSVFATLPRAYLSLINMATLPVAKITLAVTSPIVTAYFDVKKNGIPECERLVRAIFTNNYFEVVDSPDADLYIEYATEFKMGREVDGELYNYKEYFCSLSVKIYNNGTKSLLGEYALPSTRVLVPENKSADQAAQMCAREMMKQFRVKLPAVLKNIKM